LEALQIFINIANSDKICYNYYNKNEEKNMKRAFTTAEVLITLMVLGIIGAILIPSLINSAPDKDLAKFRKAYNTIQKAVTQLTNTGIIYPNGNFNYFPADVSTSADKTVYFCKQFADQLTTSGEVDCSSTTAATTSNIAYVDSASLDTMDGYCTKRTDDNYAFKTPDNIVWWGMNDDFSTSVKSGGIETSYVILCFDVNNSDSDVEPFSFGIRADGKVLPGKRAQEWLEKEKIR
jgi:type II secretory pathway pseudopilin PulG